MAPDDSTPRVPQGPVGGYVIAGLQRRRKELDLTYKDLHERLTQIGRPIPTLGLSRIERGERRVDADDLVALAIALDTSPSMLLLPPDVHDDDTEVALTGDVRVPYRTAREWMRGHYPLPDTAEINWQRGAFVWRASPAELSDLGRRMELVEASQELLWRAVLPVAAAIVTTSDAVLISRRHDGKPPWGFITGEMEPGERAEDAAVREVKEETGLEVRVGSEIGRREHPATGRRMIYLAAAPVRGTDIFVGDESELAEVRWASLADAEQLLPDMYEPVREYLARKIGR